MNRSAVLQLAYASAATPSQRTSLYRELWGKDFALLGNRRRAQLALLGQPLTIDPESPGTGAEHDSLGALFAADPSVKPRVLRQMEATLSKAARKLMRGCQASVGPGRRGSRPRRYWVA